jgi:hypothetical protein
VFLTAPLALRALSASAGGESPDPGPDAVDVPVRQIYDMSEGGYFEGSYSYVRIERSVAPAVAIAPNRRSGVWTRHALPSLS